MRRDPVKLNVEKPETKLDNKQKEKDWWLREMTKNSTTSATILLELLLVYGLLLGLGLQIVADSLLTKDINKERNE